MGDATNLVLIFAGELLKQAESLLVMGLHPSEVIQGYELGRTKALEELESPFISSQIFPQIFLTFFVHNSTLKSRSLQEIHCAGLKNSPQTGDRLQAIWLGGRDSIIGRRGCDECNANRTFKFQRRQCPRRQNHGW
jgi:hypothetical protein